MIKKNVTDDTQTNFVKSYLQEVDDEAKFIFLIVCHFATNAEKPKAELSELNKTDGNDADDIKYHAKDDFFSKGYTGEKKCPKRSEYRKCLQDFLEIQVRKLDTKNFSFDVTVFAKHAKKMLVEPLSERSIKDIESSGIGFPAMQTVFCLLSSMVDCSLIQLMKVFITKLQQDIFDKHKKKTVFDEYIGQENQHVLTIVSKLLEGRYDLPEDDESPIVKNELLSKLIQTPRYEDTTRLNKDEDVSLSPLDHTSVSFQERNKETNQLKDFLQTDNAFQMLFLIAPSGAGKTRLVTEWFRKYVNEKEWQKGFLLKEFSLELWEKWQEQPILCDTLIVVDYIYRFKDILKFITEKGAFHAQENSEKSSSFTSEKIPRLRLVILDHVLPTDFSFELLDSHKKKGLGADKGSVKHHIQNSIHPHSPIYLNQQTSEQNEALIKSIIADVYGNKTDADSIDLAYDILRHIDEQIDTQSSKNNKLVAEYTQDNKVDIAFANYPLFAILIGQALKRIKQEGGNINQLKKWQRADLINYYFSRDNRLPWKSNDVNGQWIAAAVSAATVLQGMGFEPYFDYLANNENVNLDDDIEKSIIDTCNYIVSSNNLDELKKYEPDILGETFFLLFFKHIKRNQTKRNFFFNLLCNEPLVRSELPSINRRFIEFIQLTARNLSNDEQEHSYIVDSWTILQNFLAPSNFENSLDMKLSSIIANIEVVQVLKQNTQYDFINLQKLFIENLVEEDIQFLFKIFYEYDALDSERVFNRKWFYLLSTLTLYIDWQLSKNGLTPELAEQYTNFIGYYERTSKSNKTKVFIPCRVGAKHVMKWMFEVFKININYQDSQGATAFMFASQEGKSDIVEVLLSDTNVYINKAGMGMTPLMLASFNGQISVVNMLLKEKNININKRNLHKNTALMLACDNGKNNIVKQLLECKNIRINKKNQDKQSALHMACRKGSHYIVKQFLNLNKYVEVNSIDINGLTPLSIACLTKNYACVEQLLEHNGIQINQVNGTSYTPLILASNNNDSKLVSMLLQKKNIDINYLIEENGFQRTALIIACLNNNKDIVEQLVRYSHIENNWNEDTEFVIFSHAFINHSYFIVKLLNKKFPRLFSKYKLCQLLINKPDYDSNKLTFFKMYVGSSFPEYFIPLYRGNWYVCQREDKIVGELFEGIKRSEVNFILNKPNLYSIRVNEPKFYPKAYIAELLFFNKDTSNIEVNNYESIVLMVVDNNVELIIGSKDKTYYLNDKYSLYIDNESLFSYLQFTMSTSSFRESNVIRIFPSNIEHSELKALGLDSSMISKLYTQESIEETKCYIDEHNNAIISNCAVIHGHMLSFYDFSLNPNGKIELLDSVNDNNNSLDIEYTFLRCCIEKFSGGIRFFIPPKMDNVLIFD